MKAIVKEEITAGFERHAQSFQSNPLAAIASSSSRRLPTLRAEMQMPSEAGDAPLSPTETISKGDLMQSIQSESERGRRFSMRPPEQADPNAIPFQGSVSSLPTGKEAMWWRAEQDWVVTRGKAMLSAFVKSKGWLAEAPLSKAAHASIQDKYNCLQRWIIGSQFDMICAAAIISNSVLLGYQVEYQSMYRSEAVPWWSIRAQAAFNVWFALELMMRIWALGAGFIFSKYWKWNAFDFIIVSISMVEFWIQVKSDNENGTFAVVRVLRILRLVRAVRIIRVVRFFSQLRLMVNSTMNSFMPFFWAFCLLFLLIYIVAIQVTQNVNEFTSIEGQEDDLMLEYFGTLHYSVYTLFQMISGGVSWRDPVVVLHRIHWSYAVLMSMFVSFTVFAVLNIVTGVFVGSAMHTAQQDQDVVIQDAMNEEDSFAHEVLRIFEEADTDHSGHITCDELEVHLQDPRVRAYLHHLALDVAEARGLFNLLDICNTGRVSSHEFLLGCMRLKGPAKNVDVATILYENKRMMDTWSIFMSFVEDQFSYLNAYVMYQALGGVDQTLMTVQESPSEEVSSPGLEFKDKVKDKFEAPEEEKNALRAQL